MRSFVSIFVLFLASAAAFAPSFNAARRFAVRSVEMKTSGKVKFFDVTKGFGFITPTDGTGDVFVHQTAIHSQGFRSLAEGEDVEFDIAVDDKTGKKFASNVTGPAGAFVQGAPRKERSFDNNRY